MSSLDERFLEYFASLDRAGEDRCFLCRRTPADVKAFFGFAEDGTPLEAEGYGIEDVVPHELDIMSYRGTRPVCAVCQLSLETIFLAGGHAVLRRVLHEIEHERERLWSDAADDGPRDRSSAPRPREEGEGRDEPA